MTEYDVGYWIGSHFIEILAIIGLLIVVLWVGSKQGFFRKKS
jgi:hypothetical protein